MTESWRIYRFRGEHGCRRAWRPILETDSAILARERFGREWAALERGHLFLALNGHVVRHVRAAASRRKVK
jgi:hypothetical protein